MTFEYLRAVALISAFVLASILISGAISDYRERQLAGPIGVPHKYIQPVYLNKDDIFDAGMDR